MECTALPRMFPSFLKGLSIFCKIPISFLSRFSFKAGLIIADPSISNFISEISVIPCVSYVNIYIRFIIILNL